MVDCPASIQPRQGANPLPIDFTWLMRHNAEVEAPRPSRKRPWPNGHSRQSCMFSRDPKYSIAIAKIALDHIAALDLPADPPSFALWYAYAAAQNPRINQQINDLLAGNAELSVAAIDRICEEHLSPLSFLPRLEKVGDDLATEVDHIVDLVEAATGSAAAYRADLTHADRELGRPVDRDAIRKIVQTLVQSTSEMEYRNSTLETALKVSKQVIEDLKKDVDRIRGESLRDPLTSLSNRSHFEQTLAQSIATLSGAAEQTSFSMLLIDIDHFKKFNDTHGHQIGDDVLRLIAQGLKESVNGRALAARYGGEEFAVLLPDSDLDGAKVVAEDIRTAISRKVLRKRSTGETLGRVTVSIGAAEYQRPEDLDEFVHRVDRLLYAAKQTGRNVVCW
jgi:diguanylate cyclase